MNISGYKSFSCIDSAKVSIEILLPHAENEPGYAIFSNQQAFEQYFRMVQSYIGTSVTSGLEYVETAQLPDPIRNELPLRDNYLIFSFQLFGTQALLLLEEMAGHLRRLIETTPVRKDEGKRTNIELLFAFEDALNENNLVAAQKLFSALVAVETIGHENKAFLQVRLLELQQEWSQILQICDEISYQVKSKEVRLAYLRAWFYRNLSSDILSSSPQSILQKYMQSPDRSSVETELQALSGSPSEEIAVLFVLQKVSTSSLSKPDRTLLSQIRQYTGVYQIAYDALVGLVPDQAIIAEDDRFAMAKKLYEDDAFGDSLELLYSLNEFDLGVVKYMLRMTVELDDKFYYKRTGEILSTLDKNALNLSPRYLERWEKIVNADKINGWFAWFESLGDTQRYTAQDKYNLAKENIQSWVNDEKLSDAVLLEKAISGVADNPSFIRCMDAIVESLVENPESPVEHSKICPLLLMSIVMNNHSTKYLDLFYRILKVTLEKNPDQKTYKEIIMTVHDLWNLLRGQSNYEFLLEIAALLFLHAKPDRKAYDSVLNTVIGYAGEIHSKLTDEHHEMLVMLVEDNNIDSSQLSWFYIPVEVDAAVDTIARFLDTGPVIVLYTTNPRVSSQVKNYFERNYNYRILISNDDVASDSLRSLSSKADLFLFVWRQASHSAFYCIKDHCLPQALVMVPGTSSNSIINCVKTFPSQIA